MMRAIGIGSMSTSSWRWLRAQWTMVNWQSRACTSYTPRNWLSARAVGLAGSDILSR
jgi:hypothetical protein